MKATLAEKTRASLIKFHMIDPGENLLAAVSGGADSVGLLRVLKELEQEMGYHLYAMHVEHGLRGTESLEDQRFVLELCAGWNIPCHTVSVPVQTYATDHGCGTEEAARILRYESLEKQRQTIEAQTGKRCRIAVAHHREDQAETVLFHLCRGSGLRGLRGMLPVSGEIVRPFLEVERREIREYLTAEGIGWREDATNEEDAYTRNAIRHLVLPLLTEKINSQSIRHIGECAGELAQIQEYMEEQAKSGLASCVLQRKTVPCAETEKKSERKTERTEETDERTGVVISASGEGISGKVILGEDRENSSRTAGILRIDLSIANLLSYPAVLQDRILCLALAQTTGKMRDLQRVHIEAIRQLAAGGENGSLSMPYGVTVTRSYDRLCFLAVQAADKEKEKEKLNTGLSEEETGPEKKMKWEQGFPVPRREDYLWEVLPNPFPDGIVPQKKYTKWFDYDKIGLFLEFRTRKTRDRITVKEDGSSKKLSRLMIDSKVPSVIREQMVLPCLGSEVLWLPGVRINEAYRVHPGTKRVLKITLKSEAGEYGGREDVRDHPRADQ